MNTQPRRNRKVRIAGTILIALLLTIAILPGAAFAEPPPVDGDPPPTNQNNPPPNQINPPPNQNNPPPTNQNNPPPTNQNNPPPTGGGQEETSTSDPHPDAPSTPSNDCVVTHAATPAQLCPVAGGLQYYFIGADGSTSIGPFISPFSDLAALYTAGAALLYSGVNPLTAKSVQIHYLASDSKIRVSTYYPDTQYDTDKPYTFTVNGSNAVSIIAW
ncbi:MAG: hypothetical protein OXC27_22610 [Caldilineaceae bacterium]|nr:hypothetical protein [Caldilineaceae bacterium]